MRNFKLKEFSKIIKCFYFYSNLFKPIQKKYKELFQFNEHLFRSRLITVISGCGIKKER